MSLWVAALMGLIQGLTEFLPVSSSGHLELAKALLGDEALTEAGLHFTIVLHAATALATIMVFRKDIAAIFIGLVQGDSDSLKFALAIILSMVPAVFVGLAYEDELDRLFSGSVNFVASMLMITGFLLLLADRAKNTKRSVGPGQAALIGIAQAIAILPGISRSGATIATSVLLGVDRSKAARFSFLMVVPLILGKMLIDIRSMAVGSYSGDVALLPLMVGFAVAFIVGVFACRFMIERVKRARLSDFAWYCFLIAGLSFSWQLLI